MYNTYQRDVYCRPESYVTNNKGGHAREDNIVKTARLAGNRLVSLVMTYYTFNIQSLIHSIHDYIRMCKSWNDVYDIDSSKMEDSAHVSGPTLLSVAQDFNAAVSYETKFLKNEFFHCIMQIQVAKLLRRC